MTLMNMPLHIKSVVLIFDFFTYIIKYVTPLTQKTWIKDEIA